MDAGYLTMASQEFGIPLWLLMIILSWTLVWKLLAMWKSARKGSAIWFIALAVLNTVGILPILYIYVFSEMKFKKSQKRTSRKK